MSLVHARYPGLPSGPGEEMQFDITCLDSLALRQLMDLTQACARAAKVSQPCCCELLLYETVPFYDSPGFPFFWLCDAVAALSGAPVCNFSGAPVV